MLICTLEVETILFNSSDGFLEFKQFSPRIVFFFFFLQHARGFIDGYANRVTLISWEAEHLELYFLKWINYLIARLERNVMLQEKEK